jgi:flavodoxin I
MKIKIVYETQSGTTQYVAELMQKELQALGHQADIHSVRYDGMQPDFSGYDGLLFGSPTYEDGQMENSMKVFTARTTLDLSKFKIGVFGLGNSYYPQFCTAADLLVQWVEKNQGKALTAPLKIDGFPDDVAPIQKWVGEFVAAAKV